MGCLAVLVAVLVFPAAASANAPQCNASPRVLSVPAGVTVQARISCDDSDGDPIEIEIMVPPEHGTLAPPSTTGGQWHYTTNPDAEGKTDTFKFRAVAGGELSEVVTVDINIGPVNHAPVCHDIALSVQTGSSVKVPFDCTEPDDEYFEVIIEDGPTHGVFEYGNPQLYTPAAGFSGEDFMTFRAIDWWGADSIGAIRITVTPTPKPSPQPKPSPGPSPQPLPDVTAPTLDLRVSSSLTLRKALRRGIRVTATTNEAGPIVLGAFVTRKLARRLRIDRKAQGAVLVASRKRDISAGKSVFKLKLSSKARRRLRSKARRRLRRATNVKLRIVARIADSAGNARTETLRIRLKRRPPS